MNDNNNRSYSQDDLAEDEGLGDIDVGLKGGLADESSLVDGDQSTEVGSQKPVGSSGGRGFASMSKDQQRQIASKGGKAAHRQGKAHEWTSQEARDAGAKGGKNRSIRAAA